MGSGWTVWRGHGNSVFALGLGSFLLGGLIGSLLDPDGGGASLLAALGLIAGGIASWVLGKRWNAHARDHSLFLVPVEWWGVVMVIAGVALASVSLLTSQTGPGIGAP